MRLLIPLLTCAMCSMMTACSDTSPAVEDVDKLVAEMSQRVQATTEMEKRGELIPRYNQPMCRRNCAMDCLKLRQATR